MNPNSSREIVELRSMPPDLPVIASGGEAVIYKYSRDIALKIYKPQIDLSHKERRVRIFLERQFPNSALAPLQALPYRNNFVGFAMNLAPNSKKLYDYLDMDFLAREGISNKDLLEILIEYGKLLRQLHGDGFIIGDICPYNVLVSGKEIFIPDVDSWGIEGVIQPDAYKEDYAPPESCKGVGRYEFSNSTDLYSFAVMAFYVLTKIHPFGGTWVDNPDMKTEIRMKRKISVLGEHNITIPRFVPSWKWMNPELLTLFQEIFEGDKRVEIIQELENQLQNLEFCPIHKVYYYSKYEECPVCNKDAVIETTPQYPKITQADMSRAPKVTVTFESSDVERLLDRYTYISTNNELVHISTNRRVFLEDGKQVFFTQDGEYIYYVDENSIDIVDSQKLERKFFFSKKNYGVFIQEDKFYYIDENHRLVKQSLTGTMEEQVVLAETGEQVLFAGTSTGKLIALSVDAEGESGTLSIRGRQTDISFKNAIEPKECIVRYDPGTLFALIMCKVEDGKYNIKMYDRTTQVVDKNLFYNIPSLSGSCVNNRIVYVGGDKKIIGINCEKNMLVEFACDVVQEDSILEFSNGVFTIINKDKIYRFGN